MPEELGAEKVRGQSVDFSKEEAPQISVYGGFSCLKSGAEGQSRTDTGSPHRFLSLMPCLARKDHKWSYVAKLKLEPTHKWS